MIRVTGRIAIEEDEVQEKNGKGREPRRPKTDSATIVVQDAKAKNNSTATAKAKTKKKAKKVKLSFGDDEG